MSPFTPPNYLLDGNYALGVEVDRAAPVWPFRQNGDIRTLLITRRYRRLLSNYVRGNLGVDTDRFYKDAYLIDEPDPQPTQDADLIAVEKTFSRIPSTQTIYSTLSLTKPTAASVGGTTPSSAAFWETLAGLSFVGLYTTYSNYVFAPSNEIYGPQISCTSSNSGADTRLEFSSPHGIAGTETIICRGAAASSVAYGIVEPAGYSVIDADTIDILGYNLGSNAVYVAVYLRDYTPGIDRVGCKITSNFYLPGITSGITTPADIPIPSPLLNDTEFINEVISTLTGYVDYDAKELVKWRDGPIYQLDTIQINMADV